MLFRSIYLQRALSAGPALETCEFCQLPTGPRKWPMDYTGEMVRKLDVKTHPDHSQAVSLFSTNRLNSLKSHVFKKLFLDPRNFIRS